MQEINITEIDWKFYPRAEHKQEQVDLYRLAVDSLPPIAVNQNMLGIDGYHRCQAYRQEGKDTIPAIIEQIEDDAVLYESVKRNSIHGLQLSMSDKRRNGIALYPQYTVEEIANLLGVNARSVMNWTADRRAAEQDEEDRVIWGMWLGCKTQEEIAEAIKQTQQQVANRITNLRKVSKICISPDPLKVVNLWGFGKPDERFGIIYPGRIPGQVLEHLLYYFTEPFDTVMDLFGGGGVTVDVAKHMARRYRVYDIEPVRDDIIEHDATNGVPGGAPAPKLIFLDPPYWKQKQGDYTEHETNLVNMELDQFHSTLADIVTDCRSVADWTALIIGQTQDGMRLHDHALEIVVRCGIPYHRIQVPYTTEQYKGAQINHAKENKQLLNLNRDLLIWGNK